MKQKEKKTCEKKKITRCELTVKKQQEKKKMRISELPIGIVQHIQSLLDEKEAARTSILSKSWYDAWSTSPILVFDNVGYFRLDDQTNDRDTWNYYVWTTMERYQNLNLKLQKLVLKLQFPNRHVDDVADGSYTRLLAYAAKLGVTELDVVTRSGNITPLVFGITSLVKLSITGSSFTKLEHRRLEGTVLCSSLVSLHLDNIVSFIPSVFEDILQQCPLIENLHLSNMLSNAYYYHDWPKVKLVCPRLISLSLRDVTGAVADAVMNNVVLWSPLVESFDFHAARTGYITPWSFSSVKSFTSLAFSRCTVRFPTSKLLCSQLVSLRFEFVSVTDALMQSILLSCPLIENLHLEQPKGLKGINVSKMHNLVSLSILTGDTDSSFKVSFKSSITKGLDDVPKFKRLRKSFSTRGIDDVAEFKRLRSLSLGFVRVDDDFFNKFSTRFPCVEDLTLRLHHGSEDIRISSQSIKYFSLHHLGKLHRAEFDLLNIRKFVFNVEDVLPSFSFRTGSTDWESQLKLSACPLSSPTPVVDSSWFLKLREILKEVSQSRISLCVKVDKQNIFWVKDLPSSPTPVVVENLMVHEDESSSLLPTQAYLSALFGCCRPAFITLNRYPKDSYTYNFAQFLHELLVSQNTMCTSRIQFMSHLEEIDIELYSELDRQTIPLTKFVEDAPVIPLNKEQVRFRFKWGASKST